MNDIIACVCHTLRLHGTWCLLVLMVFVSCDSSGQLIYLGVFQDDFSRWQIWKLILESIIDPYQGALVHLVWEQGISSPNLVLQSHLLVGFGIIISLLLSVVEKMCWLWPSLVYEDILNPPSLSLLPHFQFSYRNTLLGLSIYKNEHVKEVYHESWKEFMKEKHVSSLNTVFPGVFQECIASNNHRVVGSPVCSVEY